MTSLLSPETTTVPELTDRCDRCSAAAKLVVTLTSGGELAFCGHHANQHRDDIVRVGERITLEEGFEWAGK
jgi:hypothetical protein